MAASSVTCTSMFDELLQCLICFEQYKTPKELACHHTFCEDCLHRWMKQNKGGCTHVIVCPTCRIVTHLPKNGIESLPSDFKINRLSEILQNVDINGPEKTVCGIFCDVCSAKEIPAVARYKCEQCNNHLCIPCATDHDNTVVFQAHNLYKVPEHRIVKKYYCKNHSQKTLDYVCTSCNTVICSICCQTEHKLHSIEDIDTALGPIRETLKMSLTEIESKLSASQFTGQLHRLHSVDKQMAHAFIEAEEKISKVSKSCIQKVQECEQRLIEELQIKKSNAAKQLQFLYEDITFQQGCMENVYTFLQRALRMNDPVEMYALQGQLQERIDSLLSETIHEVPKPDEFCTIQFQTTIQVNDLGKFVPCPLVETETSKCCPRHGPMSSACGMVQKELENQYSVSEKRKCCQHVTAVELQSKEITRSPKKSPKVPPKVPSKLMLKLGGKVGKGEKAEKE